MRMCCLVLFSCELLREVFINQLTVFELIQKPFGFRAPEDCKELWSNLTKSGKLIGQNQLQLVKKGEGYP